ncbi:MAG: hypothetical protein FWH32_06985, partial [Clostridiales bacterium]|nr:hypothetical protein [Clostridiales bacterium]
MNNKRAARIFVWMMAVAMVFGAVPFAGADGEAFASGSVGAASNGGVAAFRLPEGIDGILSEARARFDSERAAMAEAREGGGDEDYDEEAWEDEDVLVGIDEGEVDDEGEGDVLGELDESMDDEGEVGGLDDGESDDVLVGLGDGVDDEVDVEVEEVLGGSGEGESIEGEGDVLGGSGEGEVGDDGVGEIEDVEKYFEERIVSESEIPGDPFALPEGGMSAMAIRPRAGVYIDLVDFRTVRDVSRIIDLALDYVSEARGLNFLLVINSGPAFNVGTGTIRVYNIPWDVILIWGAACTTSTSKSNGNTLLGINADGEFHLIGGGSLTHHGRGVAFSGGDLDDMYVNGGRVSSYSGLGISGLNVHMIKGTVSTKSGEAINARDVYMHGGTVSATTGTAVQASIREMYRGTIKATTGKALDLGHNQGAYIYGGRVTVTTGTAIEKEGTSGRVEVHGGTVRAANRNTGTAISASGTTPVDIRGGEVLTGSGYAVVASGNVSVSGGRVTGVSTSGGNVTVSGWGSVGGVHAVEGEVSVSGAGTVLSENGPAVMAKGKVVVSEYGAVINEDGTAAAIVTESTLDVSDGGQVIAFGINADAADTAGEITVSGGMIAAAGLGTAINNPPNATISGGRALSVAGAAVKMDDPDSTITVSGGTVDTYFGNYGIETNGDVNVTSGVVASEAGTAIYGKNLSKTLDMSGGFAYSGAGDMDKVIDWAGTYTFNNPDGEAIICTRNDDPWNRSFYVGDTSGLAWDPDIADATVFWDKEDWGGYTAFGLRYAYGASTGFHEVSNASVFDVPQDEALSISPNHVILTDGTQEVELVAALSVAGADMDDIDWSLDIADVVGLNGTAADIASGGSV